MKKIIITALTFVLSVNSFCQTSNLDSLYNDVNFTKDVELNIKICTAIDSIKYPNLEWIKDDSQYNQLVNNLKESNSDIDVKNVLTQNNIENADYLVGLINEKVQNVILIKNKFPELQTLTSAQLNDILKINYQKNELYISNRHAPGCPQDYASSISDCDADYALAVGGVLFGGGLAGIFGSPFAGAAVISGGIAIATVGHTRCRATAVRSYRNCMGYH